MKNLVLALVILLASYGIGYCSEGHKKVVVNNTYVTNEVIRHNAFDYGTYLNLICFETKNSEWGILGTWLNESDETRVYLGGKIYLNRLTYQKKDE